MSVAFPKYDSDHSSCLILKSQIKRLAWQRCLKSLYGDPYDDYDSGGKSFCGSPDNLDPLLSTLFSGWRHGAEAAPPPPAREQDKKIKGSDGNADDEEEEDDDEAERCFFWHCPQGWVGHSTDFSVVFTYHKTVFYGFRQIYVVIYEQTTKETEYPPVKEGIPDDDVAAIFSLSFSQDSITLIWHKN